MLSKFVIGLNVKYNPGLNTHTHTHEMQDETRQIFLSSGIKNIINRFRFSCAMLFFRAFLLHVSA